MTGNTINSYAAGVYVNGQLVHIETKVGHVDKVTFLDSLDNARNTYAVVRDVNLARGIRAGVERADVEISPLLTEGDIRVVLRRRKLAYDTPYDDLTEREIELAEAEACAIPSCLLRGL